MRNLILTAFFVLSLFGISNAQERQASLPQGREVEKQNRDAEKAAREAKEAAAKSAAEAADRRSVEKQVDAIKAGAQADRENTKGHGIEAAQAEKNAERAAAEAEKAKREAVETQKEYDRVRTGPDKP